jgi:phosphatidylserine/phosphatidylglycerophosphate/cardiolipin synthase-like enzyme
MKKTFAVILLALVISTVAWTAVHEGGRRTCFTPGDDCTAFLIGRIARARSELLVMAYYFTDDKLVTAICDARDRHVAVSVLLDRTNEQCTYEGTTAKLGQCADVMVDDHVAIQHNKVLVIDRTDVITGSFNLTKSAQKRNAENLLLTADPDTAAAYADYFQARRMLARPLRSMEPCRSKAALGNG